MINQKEKTDTQSSKKDSKRRKHKSHSLKKAINSIQNILSQNSRNKRISQLFINPSDYKVIKLLVHGDLNSVYLVENISTKERFAASVHIKSSPLSSSNYNNTANNFYQYQAKIIRYFDLVSNFDHPTLSQTVGLSLCDFKENHHDINANKNVNIDELLCPTVISTLCENGTLASVLDKSRKGNKLSWLDNTAKQIMITGLAKAIQVLHSKKICHNSIKPKNIVLDSNNEPHLSGFYASTFFDEEFSDEVTALYMAPEIITEEHPPSHKIDIFAYGITAYEIITEIIPYSELKAQSLFKLQNSIATGKRPAIPTGFNPSIASLLEKCWDQEPENRPTAEEIFHKLSSDLSYLLDGVDQSKFTEYVKSISLQTHNEISIHDHDLNEAKDLNKLEKMLLEMNKSNSDFDKTKLLEYERKITDLENQNKFLIQEKEKLQQENVEKDKSYSKIRKERDFYHQKYEELKNVAQCNKPWSSESNVKNAIIDLNEYEKKEKLSFGTFGDVYSVYHKESHEEFAAKVSKYPLSNNSTDLREINILCQLKHPSIVNMKGFSFTNFEHENCITILMELMQHGSLQKLLDEEQNGNLKLDYNNTQRQIIITGIAYGMKYLHEHHIFHRDLKPGNILIDSELHPKITDFGTSKFFDPDHCHSQTQQHGTLFYMSPESFIDNHYGPESDVYSYGIMLYEILTSLPAYDMTQPEINTTLKFSNKVAYQNYRPKFTIPIQEEFQKLIEQCWDSEPLNRPTFSDIFIKLSSDSRYLLDDVDENEFSNYLYDLEQSEKNDNIVNIRNEEEMIKLLRDNELLRQENALLKQQYENANFPIENQKIIEK
ncbi:hypothetical protein TRFO_38079 [Tritrichomonas foetus]|uniref:non-specific serine/threonine protein kinase n=1 Tax=Tritrichomonas foetus TaxID=1144522 RepID=A0A1J4JEU2_9EUKA|nr:hypothetical protein TRFO_38079 [Tritrichomonas foetus]|eukprot:OHS95780.1 hypothetical protein TRFO_38079 [Tritrichomonas foetus]